MTKATRAQYTLEFKEKAVRLVTGGQRIAAVAKTLGLSEQTLHNWVKAASNGGLKGPPTSTVSAEHMEIGRLAAVPAQVDDPSVAFSWCRFLLRFFIEKFERQITPIA
ncbi:transposase [Azospirillum doebereinerae]